MAAGEFGPDETAGTESSGGSMAQGGAAGVQGGSPAATGATDTQDPTGGAQSDPPNGGSMSLGCDATGALRCGDRPGSREVCRDGTWVSAVACEDGTVCDPSAPSDCVAVESRCIGHEGGAACDDAGTMFHCDLDGMVTSMEYCDTVALCEAGFALAAMHSFATHATHG